MSDYSIMNIGGIDCYEKGGIAYLKLDAVAYGLGFTQTQNKNGTEYTSVRWETINRYLSDFGFPVKMGKDDFIPENIFYRLAMKAKNASAEAFQAKVADEIIPSIRKTGSYSMGNHPMTQLEILAAQAQALVEQERKLNAHEAQLVQLEAHQKNADKRLDTVEQKIVEAAEAFKAPSFHPDTWQRDTNEAINQIIEANGLNHQKYRESLYSRLESIAGVNLRKRQTRTRTRMTAAGATKTQLAEVSKLSVIARDKKLRVIFDGILREERANNIVVA